jgi:hypothetical protein
MGLNWKQWSKNDIIFGIIVPVIVVLVIVAFANIRTILGGTMESLGIVIGITMEITELTIIVGVPLMLGLVWNRWAGGASGFLMGTFYALYWSGSGVGRMEGGGTILIAYILSAMLIGFMAGSLNKGSEDFKRMLISGLVASTTGGIMLIGIFQIAPSNVVTGVDAIIYNVLPRMLMGVIIAAVAKVFFWYGMGVHSKTNQ